MCLLIRTWAKPRISKKLITCYKVLIVKDGKYKTPFINQTVELKRFHRTQDLFNIYPSNDNFRYRIENGGFHLYKNFKDAYSFAEDVVKNESNTTTVIVESVIPPYTVYFKGKNQDNTFGYCTQRIFYDNIVAEIKS